VGGRGRRGLVDVAGWQRVVGRGFGLVGVAFGVRGLQLALLGRHGRGAADCAIRVAAVHLCYRFGPHRKANEMMRWLLILIAALTTLAIGGCGYNDFQKLDEQAKAAWSEVLNQYQRRADLVPNLVATVKGEANFEQDTLTKVVEARAKATSIQATPELINNPEAFEKFQRAQGELTSA